MERLFPYILAGNLLLALFMGVDSIPRLWASSRVQESILIPYAMILGATSRRCP